MTEQSLTLHDILVEPLRLLEMLEELQERDEGDDGSIAEIEQALTAYIEATPAKVDNFAGFLRECEDRAEIHKREGERLLAIAKRWESRKKYLEQRAIQGMQAAGKEKVEGKFNTLALRKNPPAVEIAQEALLPKEYCNLKVKLPESVWQDIVDAIGDDALKYRLEMSIIGSQSEPMKAEIARVLKSTEPCPKCHNGKIMTLPREHGGESEIKDCEDCGGSGKVSKGVPGARLVQTQRLEVR